MAWWEDELATIIVDRANEDTGSGGLFNATTPLIQDIWWYRSANAIELDSDGLPPLPWIAFDMQDDTATDAFETDIIPVVILFNIFDRAEKGLTRVNVVKERLYGDGIDPSYGFHRWIASSLNPSVDEWTPTAMRYQGRGRGGESDEDIVHEYMRFIIYMSRRA